MTSTSNLIHDEVSLPQQLNNIRADRGMMPTGLWTYNPEELVAFVEAREKLIREQAANTERLMIHSRFMRHMLFLKISVNAIREKYPDNLTPENFDNLFGEMNKLWESIDQSQFKPDTLSPSKTKLKKEG